MVMRRTLVGRRTGPFTFRRLSLAPLIRSAQTFSRFFTLREVSVMRMRWSAAEGATSSSLPAFIGADIVTELLLRFSANTRDRRA